MTRKISLLLLLAPPLVGTSCDSEPLVYAPEVEARFDFAEGFEGWNSAGTDLDDPPVEWSIELSGEEARSGDRSVRLFLHNVNDAGKIWIQRAFELTPDQGYSVEVRYAFGTSDWGDVNHWTRITGVHLDAPETRDDLTFQGDTSNGASSDVGIRWIDHEHAFEVRTGSDGVVWVALGVWGTWETARTYFLDEVEVTFLRR